ncbi:MAG: phage tail tape measure protein [Patescibacteria group bacterium]
MAYDAGAAVGYLRLDADQWNNTIKTALVEVTKLRTALAAITNVQRRMIQKQNWDVAKDTATARIATRKEAELAQKASIATSLAMTRGQVRQQTAIAIDAARTQSRATLMETQHGYRLAEIEARRMARSHVGAFTQIKQAGMSAFNSIGTTMTRLRYGAQLVATTFVVSFGIMAWQFSKLLKGFAEFEQRMRKATSVTRYTEDEFRAMSVEAETAAKKWGIPARDAADAFLFLGRAGLTAAQQLDAMPPIVAASKAMMEDLEETAEGTVNVMNAFNLSFDQTTHVTDMMTEAVNSSTMNLHEFLVSLSYAAKPAAAFNNTMQDTAAMIGIAANAGIRGSKAGTALRYALTQLSAPTSGMRRLMRELHLQIYDTSGAMLPFVDIMQQIQDKLVGASEETRNYTLKTLFGQRALSTMIAIFEKGAVGVRAYANQIANAGNVTQTTAQKQMMAMKSQLEKLRETWDALKRHIVDTFAPDIVRAIKIIISHVDDWTLAIDNNRERVRSFAKEILGFFISFAKITAGAAAFALLARVLGGIVMILQAILSPLGVVIVAVLTLQTAWRKNFLGMRDVGHAVFEFLRNDAIDFFVTLINGIDKAVGFVINSMHRMMKKDLFIPGMAASIEAGINKVQVGNALAEKLQSSLYKAFTAGGKPLRKGIEDMLAQYPAFYDAVKGMYKGAPLTDTDYLSKLAGAAVLVRTETAQSVEKDIYDMNISATEALRMSLLATGKALAETITMDIGSITAGLKNWIPADMLAGWQKLMDMMNDIASGRTIGEAVSPNLRYGKSRTLRGGYVLPTSVVSTAMPMIPEGENRKLFGRMKLLYTNFLDAYVDDWREAIGKVVDGFKTQQDVMTDMLQTIQTGWTDALDNLMKQGSSFIDFMDSFFQAILTGFRKLVAEMLSIQMFEAVFGRGTAKREGGPEAGISWGTIWRGIKYFTGSSKTFSTPYAPETSGASNAFGYRGNQDYIPSPIDIPDVPDLGGGAQKIAPPVAIHLHNESGVELSARQVKKPLFDGRQWIVNVVMEESTTNPRFREILAGGT